LLFFSCPLMGPTWTSHDFMVTLLVPLNQDLLSQQRHIFCASEPALYAAQHMEVSGQEPKIL